MIELPDQLTPEAPSSILIEDVSPVVDGGRYPIKREVGDRVDVQADIFREGHEHLLACIQYRPVDEETWREVPMRFVDNDRWGGSFLVDRNTMWEYRVLPFPTSSVVAGRNGEKAGRRGASRQ
jgi:starch synthase (maltosyl-transferring)